MCYVLRLHLEQQRESLQRYIAKACFNVPFVFVPVGAPGGHPSD